MCGPNNEGSISKIQSIEESIENYWFEQFVKIYELIMFRRLQSQQSKNV